MGGSGYVVWLFLAAHLTVSVVMSEKRYPMFSVTVTSRQDVEEVKRIARAFEEVFPMGEPRYGKMYLVANSDYVSEVRSELTSHGLEMCSVQDFRQSLKDDKAKWQDGRILTRLVGGLKTSVINHHKYHRYPEMLSMLRRLARLNPEVMEVHSLSKQTYEGRRVAYVKLNGKRNPTDSEKPAIVIEAAIHAREWISPAVNLWVIERLLYGYSRGDSHASTMLDKFDWYIIPVTNPDGYEFTHTAEKNRLWRKNRRINENRKCIGVDLNRNFNVAFKTTGIVDDPCDDTYPGRKPFSEPETANVKALVEGLRHRLVGYLSIHSFSQVILIPWGYSVNSKKPDNYAEMDRIAGFMVRAIRKRYGTRFRKGQGLHLLGYAASGTSSDWVLQEVPGIFSITVELRPTLAFFGVLRGFKLPPDQIVPSAEEYFDGLVAMTRELAKKVETIY